MNGSVGVIIVTDQWNKWTHCLGIEVVGVVTVVSVQIVQYTVCCAKKKLS